MIEPSTIHCLALNFEGVGPSRDKEPLYFIKSKNAFASNGVIVDLPKDIKHFWSEVELGIVISKDCKKISNIDAKNYIKGFVVCGDISCSNIFSRDHHLAFSKSRDSFCPTSELNQNKYLDLSNLKMRTKINGVTTQEGSSSMMIMNPYESLSYVSQITTLKKGDILITGTPPGWRNNFLKSGDEVVHEIETLGKVEFSIS